MLWNCGPSWGAVAAPEGSPAVSARLSSVSCAQIGRAGRSFSARLGGRCAHRRFVWPVSARAGPSRSVVSDPRPRWADRVGCSRRLPWSRNGCAGGPVLPGSVDARSTGPDDLAVRGSVREPVAAGAGQGERARQLVQYGDDRGIASAAPPMAGHPDGVSGRGNALVKPPAVYRAGGARVRGQAAKLLRRVLVSERPRQANPGEPVTAENAHRTGRLRRLRWSDGHATTMTRRCRSPLRGTYVSHYLRLPDSSTSVSSGSLSLRRCGRRLIGTMAGVVRG